MASSARIGIVVAILCLAVAPSAQAAGSAADLAQVDGFVSARMEKEKVPGVAIGIIRQGEVVAAKGYGYANLEDRAPVTAQSVFQSGSVGKQFTAVAVMLQVEDGKLGLEDPITKYFADAPPAWRQITVRNLLNHTSGIADYTDVIDLRRDFSEEELTRAAYRLPLQFTAGSKWKYSNTGYALLGFLIHKVSGRFYGDVLHDRVFVPLGMKTARIISEEDIVANRSAGYRLVNGVLKNQEWVAPITNTTADGALYLSVLDFIAWDRGLRQHAILKPKSWAQVYTPVTLKSGKTYPYGFGWFIGEAQGQPVYRHSGAWQGFDTDIARYLADDLTLVVLANRADAGAEDFSDGIAAILDPRLAKLRPIEESAAPGSTP